MEEPYPLFISVHDARTPMTPSRAVRRTRRRLIPSAAR